MTQAQEINYLRLALMMQDISVSNETSDRIISTWKLLKMKKGKFSVSDAVELKHKLDAKYRPVSDNDIFEETERIERERLNNDQNFIA